MAIAEFIYQGAKTNIQSYFEEKMEDILQKLCTKLELEKIVHILYTEVIKLIHL